MVIGIALRTENHWGIKNGDRELKDVFCRTTRWIDDIVKVTGS